MSSWARFIASRTAADPHLKLNAIFARLFALALALGAIPGAALLHAQDLPAGLTARLAACGACHGVDGNAPLRDTPSLAGQPVVFLENQMVLIREGIREIALMKGALEGVTDADITALARHYARQALKPPAASRDAALFAKVEKLAEQNRCGSCHLPSYAGREQMPRLAAQREDFLLHSMRQFASNQAVGRDTLMAASLHGLSDPDLVAIAHYLSRIGP